MTAERLKGAMIQSIALNELAGVRHGFFTRRGGHSRGVFRSLNCGPGSGDDRKAVLRNRATVEECMQLPTGNLLTVHQYHSPVVATVTEPWAMETAPQADAMVTNRPNVGLGILTADCVPVLFADPRNGVVGAAHAGWKGAAGGVLQATLAAIEASGGDRASTTAGTGPCIRQTSYEVGEDMRQQFLDNDGANERYFANGERDGHYQFDLAGFVVDTLRSAGAAVVDDTGNDTYVEEGDFFSFRRTTHRQEPDYGRQISVISLAP